MLHYIDKINTEDVWVGMARCFVAKANHSILAECQTADNFLRARLTPPRVSGKKPTVIADVDINLARSKSSLNKEKTFTSVLEQDYRLLQLDCVYNRVMALG